MNHEFHSVQQIVEQGYCVSCGLCEGLSEGAVPMQFLTSGQLRPNPAQITPEVEAQILEICPGINVTGPFEVPLQNPDPIWGDLRDVVMGWASDAETRFRSSAGGVMTALNRFALETSRADFILQVAASPDDVIGSEPVFIRNPEDLLTGSQSRYAPTAPLSAILKALETSERFVVSLKPCDIAGVRNLQKTDPRARDQIVFTQAMFCGTTPSRSETDTFFERRGVRTQDLAAMQWRGDGCPGVTKGTLPNGLVVDGSYSELWTGSWQTQFRCKICPDAVGLQADIATGDIWAGGMPKGETPGENAILAHTDIGQQFLYEAVRLGYLETTPLTVAAVSDSQPHHVALRQSFATRVAATTEAGRGAPAYQALAAEALTAQLSEDKIATTRQGTLSRVAAGQGDESVEFDGFD